MRKVTLLENIGITISMADLPPYTKLAYKYINLPYWLKWIAPKAKKEYERCLIERQIILLDKTITEGNKYIAQ